MVFFHVFVEGGRCSPISRGEACGTFGRSLYSFAGDEVGFIYLCAYACHVARRPVFREVSGFCSRRVAMFLASVGGLYVVVLVDGGVVLRGGVVSVSALGRECRYLRFLSSRRVVTSLLPCLVCLYRRLHTNFRGCFLVCEFYRGFLGSRIRYFFYVVGLVVYDCSRGGY